MSIIPKEPGPRAMFVILLGAVVGMGTPYAYLLLLKLFG